jgi:LacI family transcriptional regulator
MQNVGTTVESFQSSVAPPDQGTRVAQSCEGRVSSTASIKDVAAHAGVSVGTVSNVLNRPERVAEATRARVQTAIRALGFVRNEPARQLRAGRSRTIGLLVLDAANPFFADVSRGAEEAAAQAGLAVILCNSGQDAAKETSYLNLMAEQRVQGLLLTPVDADPIRLARLVERGMPVVLLDRRADGDGMCSVSVDDVSGGELALTHLLEIGHERVAFVGGPTTIAQVKDRRAGARNALTRAGRDPDSLVCIDTAAMTVAAGREAGEKLCGLPAGLRPTAVFCANDLIALGLLQELIRQGLDVPTDVAIVGYDDIEFAGAAAVPLTSVRQPRHLLGKAAAELLLEETQNPGGHVHRQIEFEPDLVVRASTQPGADQNPSPGHPDQDQPWGWRRPTTASITSLTATTAH